MSKIFFILEFKKDKKGTKVTKLCIEKKNLEESYTELSLNESLFLVQN